MQKCANVVALTVSVIGIAHLGCNAHNQDGSAPVSFVSEYAPIEFSFPVGWYVNPDNHPYDLQCFSQYQSENTGVFAYKSVDIAADSAPIDTLWHHVEDMKSKRRNFEQLEELQKREHQDKTVTAITYIGDKDFSRYCYRFSLVEFRSDDTKFAVLLQVARPGDWEKSKPVLDQIAQSARPLAERDR